MKKFSQYINEEENLQEGISKGDFVKDSQGNVHRVFDVMGNVLSVGKYHGDGKYGGTNSVHMSKVTKTQKPMEESVNEEMEQVDELSRKTLGSYMSKASDARGHRSLSTKKVDNRYAGVAKASKKIDKMNEASDSAMRSWVYYNLENTEKTHGQMKQEFIKKYGAGNAKVFDKYVSQYMD